MDIVGRPTLERFPTSRECRQQGKPEGSCASCPQESSVDDWREDWAKLHHIEEDLGKLEGESREKFGTLLEFFFVHSKKPFRIRHSKDPSASTRKNPSLYTHLVWWFGGWVIGWFVCVRVWLAGWMVGCFVAWSVGRSVGWLCCCVVVLCCCVVVWLCGCVVVCLLCCVMCLPTLVPSPRRKFDVLRNVMCNLRRIVISHNDVGSVTLLSVYTHCGLWLQYDWDEANGGDVVVQGTRATFGRLCATT